MAMVFNEYFGEIPVSLNRAIKKYNVSPADYWELEDYFGENFGEILAAIKRGSPKGYYQSYLLFA